MKIEKIDFGNGTGSIKAFIDLRTEEGFLLLGFKILESDTGLWVSWPKREVVRGGRKEYYPCVITGEPRENAPFQFKVNQFLLDEYEKATKQS